MEKVQELKLLINSEAPLIYIETWEEDRVEAMLEAIAAELQIPLFYWTVTRPRCIRLTPPGRS